MTKTLAQRARYLAEAPVAIDTTHSLQWLAGVVAELAERLEQLEKTSETASVETRGRPNTSRPAEAPSEEARAFLMRGRRTVATIDHRGNFIETYGPDGKEGQCTECGGSGWIRRTGGTWCWKCRPEKT